jgi:predicted ABC-type ATPase
MAEPGRPRADLSDEERVAGIELAERIASTEAQLRELQAERVAWARRAAAAGVSYRSIAEAIGLSRQHTFRLINEAEE